MTRGGLQQANGRRIPSALVFPLYNTALAAAAPFVRALLAARKRHRPLLQRFEPPIPAGIERPVWIHACSVGEVNLALPFIRALTAMRPDLPLLLTVSTVSGRARADEARPEGLAVTWFPFDQNNVVSRFFDAVKPRALILIETELWPNVLKCAAQRSVPVALINGRISDKHLARYRRARSLFHPLLSTLSIAAMQNEDYASRIVALGAQPDHTHVTGNLKFDGAPVAADAETAAALRETMGIPADAPVVVFGSTRPGDEAIARTAWDFLKLRFPNLVLIIAPRHPTRFQEALRPFAEDPILRRSQVLAGRAPAGERIVALDTMGELADFYAIADVAVIGGSFSTDVQGHNPIEPAALGVPVLFGPCMRNFADAAETLLKEGGAQRVAAKEIPATLDTLLNDPDRRARMGQQARKTVAAQTGATDRTIEQLNPILAGEPD